MDAVGAITRLIEAIEAGDVEGARACYHPDARIWHNNDGLFQTADENLRVLTWMVRTFPVVRYVDVRRFGEGDRAVEQHVLEVDLPENGGTVRIPACIAVTVDSSGAITLLEEYLDAAAFSPLMAAIGRT